MKTEGCASDLPAQTNVVLGASPFEVTATETNTDGYSMSFCYECEITPIGQASIFFKKDSISVRQYADCSDSLTKTDY